MACFQFQFRPPLLSLSRQCLSALQCMHPVDDPVVLVPLLQGHLPQSLPAYGALKSQSPIRAWASFTETAEPGPLWLIVILMLPPSHEQYRIYCSAEKDAREGGSDLVVEGLRELGLLSDTMLGAVNTHWASRIVQEGRASSYNVWVSNEERKVNVMSGYEIDHGREEDIPLMVATSDIPRSPSYLRSLLGQTSVAREMKTGKAVAWVVSHADSSLGTLYTLEDHRQKGLARAVVVHRIGGGETRGFAYVSEGNAPSEAVWKGLGWTVGWRAWWIVTG